MANQPPVRPWFRLAALRPVAAPAQPEPRPPLVLPTTRTNSAPSPPPKAQPTQPSEFIPPPPSNSSPAKGPTTSRGSSPDTKPMVQRQSTPVQSPPSPLTLPPSSQMKSNSEIEPKIPAEAESKNVIVQKTIEKPKERLNGNGNGNGNGKTGFAHKEKGNPRKLSDSEDSAMKVITIAGENTGAYMELIQSPNKHRFGGKPNYLHNSKTKSESEFSGSEEGNGNKNEKSKKGGRTRSSYPRSAFTNSNVQCVNNSLLYNTSCTHHNPGVRLSLSKKPSDEGFHHKEVVNGQHH